MKMKWKDSKNSSDMTTKERMVLGYVIGAVLEDLEYDGENEKYRDSGGIIVNLSEEEYNILQNLSTKL